VNDYLIVLFLLRQWKNDVNYLQFLSHILPELLRVTTCNTLDYVVVTRWSTTTQCRSDQTFLNNRFHERWICRVMALLFSRLKSI
jgi:hypothetical protein